MEKYNDNTDLLLITKVINDGNNGAVATAMSFQ